jgi:hypothetical protein
MNTRHTLLIITAQLVFVSSCAVIIQKPSPKQTDNPSTPIVSTGPVNSIHTQTYEDFKDYITLPKSVVPSKQNSDIQKPTIKLTLCNVFVPPTIPEIPRVDLGKLSSIPANDHEAVKSLLLDNIQAINVHSKKVEESLRTALLIHRRSCTLREVVDKK